MKTLDIIRWRKSGPELRPGPHENFNSWLGWFTGFKIFLQMRIWDLPDHVIFLIKFGLEIWPLNQPCHDWKYDLVGIQGDYWRHFWQFYWGHFIEVFALGTHSLIINYVPNVRVWVASILSAIKGTKLVFHSHNHKRIKLNLGKWKSLYFVLLQLDYCQLRLSQW